MSADSTTGAAPSLPATLRLGPTHLVVRDLDAHSWVEAWFPGHGWVTDLLNRPALAADVAAMTPRPDLPLESDG